jgi:hypothetical protein
VPISPLNFLHTCIFPNFFPLLLFPFPPIFSLSYFFLFSQFVPFLLLSKQKKIKKINKRAATFKFQISSQKAQDQQPEPLAVPEELVKVEEVPVVVKEVKVE